MKERSELKELAIAYELSQEFDYCPDDLKEALAFRPDVTQSILDKWSGCRPDEIVREIIRMIKKL